MKIRLTKPIFTLLATGISIGVQAKEVAHFDMDSSAGSITESISGNKYPVEGHFMPENVVGAVGNALRFDGYTSHIEASLGEIIPANSKSMTVSIWVALPCYPIIQIDSDTSEKTPIVSSIDKDNKSGFGFNIGFDGKYSFETYVSGWPLTIEVDTPLPTYVWNNLVAVVDCENRTAILYNNGEIVGSAKAGGSVGLPAGTLYMGQGKTSRKSGPFELMSYNGLIDDITIWDEAKTQSEIQGWKTDRIPDLDIPASRFAENLLRPRFHGMPAAGWTNECHGMYYSDGRYHLFFQKNGDGPYMARLHWGHISSENLYDWKEEKIAIAPGDWYDIKGCWSGCVFSDETITGGEPNIIYTAVDYAKAMIAQASPESAELNNWVKNPANPVISGRPGGLSDDFRDPYFFRNGEKAYIIVGSSKNGVGTTTLHRYNPVSGMWSNTGEQFFTGTSVRSDGKFWEMPNITKMADGKWLFTATPQATSQGVRTLYWTGSISEEGYFTPDVYSSSPRLVEMNSREGFGLLSPTIFQHKDKTIVLGIVPDKLPAATNWNLGWAHCYSLPREWRLSDDGKLLQKPFEGLTGLRTDIMYSKSNSEINGTESLNPIKGRAVELCGIFNVGSSEFGYNIFKSGNSEGKIYYSPASGEIIVDFSNLSRLSNDNGVYDGIYRCPLPERPAAGDALKINVFIDHSILDIFINDKWATSIRVFPTEADADEIEVFSTSATQIIDLKAWILDSSKTGSVQSWEENTRPETTDVHTLQGITMLTNTDTSTALDNLPKGVYIVGNKKILKK